MVPCAQDAYNAEHYTEFGIQHVEGTTFKSLLLRHYPDLEVSIGDVRAPASPVLLCSLEVNAVSSSMVLKCCHACGDA